MSFTPLKYNEELKKYQFSFSKIKVVKKLIACLTFSLLPFTFIPQDLKATTEPIGIELKNDSVGVKNKLVPRISEIRKTGENNIKDMQNILKEKESRGIISAIFFISLGAIIAFIVIMVLIV